MAKVDREEVAPIFVTGRRSVMKQLLLAAEIAKGPQVNGAVLLAAACHSAPASNAVLPPVAVVSMQTERSW